VECFGDFADSFCSAVSPLLPSITLIAPASFIADVGLSARVAETLMVERYRTFDHRITT
jgi:hypothetical protein